MKYTTPKGKIVYGGGGIIPDVFVSIDTTGTFNGLWYTNLSPFIFKYIDNHRKEMNKWELYDFVENFDKNDNIFNQYIAELDLTAPIPPEGREDLKRYFKAIMARNLFDETGYFMITQKEDNMILKVIELDSRK